MKAINMVVTEVLQAIHVSYMATWISNASKSERNSQM